MDSDLAVPLAACLGLVVGMLAVVGGWYARRAAPVHRARPGDPTISEDVARLLSVLPGAALVVAGDDRVLRASAQAVALGVVSGDRVDVPQVRALVGQVRRDGVIRELDLELARPPLRRQLLPVRVRVAPLASDCTLVLVEDVSEAVRVDAVRRDFVANVSHELKTPVGALSLLAEAVEAASDEPDEVRRFGARMRDETRRLTNLVNDLMDLSRLQGADRPVRPEPVRVRRIVTEALEAARLGAQSLEVEVVPGAIPDVSIAGDESQLVTAVRNLVTNAIAYSPSGTRVTITCGVRQDGAEPGLVEIAVRDQGIGIPEPEQARIFERFYRVDPARSRVTGGTGLGLAIVKHVCANHGGECTVVSAPGEGSTFTLRLPVATEPTTGVPAPVASRRHGEPATREVVG